LRHGAQTKKIIFEPELSLNLLVATYNLADILPLLKIRAREERPDNPVQHQQTCQHPPIKQEIHPSPLDCCPPLEPFQHNSLQFCWADVKEIHSPPQLLAYSGIRD